jgi:hypothetical protein
LYDLEILYFICGLFNDVVSSSDYTASNDEMINEYLIRKNIKANGKGLIQGTIPAFFWRD